MNTTILFEKEEKGAAQLVIDATYVDQSPVITVLGNREGRLIRQSMPELLQQLIGMSGQERGEVGALWRLPPRPQFQRRQEQVRWESLVGESDFAGRVLAGYGDN
jgi:hypothetical protein